MKFKLIIPLSLVLFPALVLVLINFYSQSLTRTRLVEGIIGQPRNLHPLRMADNPVDEDLVTLLYRPLLHYNVGGMLEPDLADSWEVSADNLTYTFHLKQDVRWHDGKRFTVDDVVFTASRHPALKQVRVEKVDEYTVKFVLAEVYAPFLDLLTIPIAPEHISLESSPLRAVGTGDFAIESIDPAPNFIQSIRLKRVNNFMPGRINQLVLQFYNDREELNTATRLGEIDTYAGDTIGQPGFATAVASMKGTNYAIFINLRRGGLLADIDFRKALAESTPRGLIANQVLGGKFDVIEGPIHDTWASNSNVTHYYFSADVSPTYTGTFTLVIPSTEDSRLTAKVLKEAWGRIGIEIKIKEVTAVDLQEQVIKNRDFDFLLLGRKVGHDPDRYSDWHSTQIDYPGTNLSGYKQVRVDKALEKGRQTLDQGERKKHYDLFQELVASDVPAIFLYQPRYFFTFRKSLKELDLRDVYSASDRYKSLNNWRIEYP